MSAKFVAVSAAPGESPEQLIVRMARVSSPNKRSDSGAERLIRYLIKHKHWSPFDMVTLTVEVTTSRAVSAQMLRHWSFRFQEYSQRYAQVPDEPVFAECRMQDPVNRQSSFPTDDAALTGFWEKAQADVWRTAKRHYDACVGLGIARETARSIIPAMSETTLFMTGSVRSYIHYLKLRLAPETQREHRDAANAILRIFRQQFPTIASVALGEYPDLVLSSNK